MNVKFEKVVHYAALVSSIILVLPLVMSVFSLFYIYMTHLSPEETEWVSSPAKYSNKSFTSNRGKTAKMAICYNYVSDTENPIEPHFLGGQWIFEASEYISWEITQDTTVMKGYLSINKPLGADSLMYSCEFFNFESCGIALDNGEITSCLPMPEVESFMVGELSLNDCLVIDYSNAQQFENEYHEFPDSMKIDKFVISKKYGPVYYRTMSGEEFIRKL